MEKQNQTIDRIAISLIKTYLEKEALLTNAKERCDRPNKPFLQNDMQKGYANGIRTAIYEFSGLTSFTINSETLDEFIECIIYDNQLNKWRVDNNKLHSILY